MFLHRAVIRIGLPVPAGAEFTLSDRRRSVSLRECGGAVAVSPAAAGDEPPVPVEHDVGWPRAVARTASGRRDARPRAGDDRRIPSRSPRSSRSRARCRPRRASTTAPAHSTRRGAQGGPVVLAAATFTPGERDPIRTSWRSSTNWAGKPSAAQSIARGQRVFETRPITITGVAGLNDQPGQATIHGTCSTCHDTAERRRSLGHAAARIWVSRFRSGARPIIPLYTFTRTADGATVQTTDPGLALIDRQVDGHGKFKVPVLRALAMRARTSTMAPHRICRPSSGSTTSGFTSGCRRRTAATSSRSYSRCSGTAPMYAL